ncbi:MAG: beta-ketoacyl-ACP synthase 3, partial [Gammaproteobacteria bacterium]
MKTYSRIFGTGSYVPSKVLTNADLEKMVETSDDWIIDRTGIKQRHIRDENDTTISMATEAGRKALEAAGIDKNKIGLIIVATTFPDRLFPNTASAVQFNLDLTGTKCPAFDVSAACTGFIYALTLADMYIRDGKAEYALVVSSESITRVVDWNDRNLCIFFGDGAVAVVLGPSDKPGIYSTHLHLDSKSPDLLYLSGDMYSKNTPPCYIQMRGNEVFKIAVT